MIIEDLCAQNRKHERFAQMLNWVSGQCTRMSEAAYARAYAATRAAFDQCCTGLGSVVPLAEFEELCRKFMRQWQVMQRLEEAPHENRPPE